MVSKFNGLDESLEGVEYLLLTGKDDYDNKEQVYNVLAWYACEYVANEYVAWTAARIMNCREKH